MKHAWDSTKSNLNLVHKKKKKIKINVNFFFQISTLQVNTDKQLLIFFSQKSV